MKPNIILSSKNDSSILDRQVTNCPDVIEKNSSTENTQKIQRGYRRDYKKNTICMKGWSLMCLSKDIRGICERDYPKIEAYLGLKNFLLRTFGVTLNIYSQKTKGDLDKTTDKP